MFRYLTGYLLYKLSLPNVSHLDFVYNKIRSDEMHRIAEFGVAAHWDYKLQNKQAKSLPEKSTSSRILALPSAINSTTPSTQVQPLAVEPNISEMSKTPPRSTRKGRVASHIEALTSSRESIVQNNLFIFLSSTKNALDGRIVSIDPSACNIADILEKYGLSLDEGFSEGIFQNGVSTSLDNELSNGDVLTLPGSIISQLNV